MKKSLVISFTILSLAILQACNTNAQVNSVKNIKQTEFEKLAKETNSIIIDVRTPSEISDGYIDGAKLFIDFNSADFESKISKLDRSKNYLVYCRSGGRSARASAIMVNKGFIKVYNLEGGITNWTGPIKK